MNRDPNIQNIPIRTPMGESIKQAIRESQDKDSEMLRFDFKNLESRYSPFIDPYNYHKSLSNK